MDKQLILWIDACIDNINVEIYLMYSIPEMELKDTYYKYNDTMSMSKHWQKESIKKKCNNIYRYDMISLIFKILWNKLMNCNLNTLYDYNNVNP